jgi:tetratricopeptide (TPR) repeat protein
MREMSTRILRSGLPLTAILALTLWTFWGVRLSPFHFDDALFLESPQVTMPGDPWYLLRPSQSRQLTYLSFYWNYRLFGNDAKGYHLVNLALHCLNVVGVYLFVRLLMKAPRAEEREPVRRWLPLVSAGIFALHPVQSEVVNYIYQRSALLAALFSLIALIAFLHLPAPGRNWFWLSLAGLSTLMASLSKETALVLPAVMCALAWLGLSRDGKEWRIDLRVRLAAAGVSLLMFSAVGWVLYNLHSKGERTVGIGAVRDSLHYLNGQAQVVVAYIGLLFWPKGLVIDHAFRASPPLSPYSILCCLVVLTLIIFFVAIRRMNPVVSACGLGFFILLAPNSSIIPSADLMFEHRLYLPMIAGSVILGWLLLRACALFPRREMAREAAGLLAAAGVLIAFSLTGRNRTFVWEDNIRLWSDAAEKAPWNPRAHYNLGAAYLQSDRWKAYREFERTVALQPGHASALYNLGWLEQSAGRLDAASAHYIAAINADANHWQSHLNLANLEVLQGRPDMAIREFRTTIRLREDYWPSYQSLAAIQLRTGDPGGALETLAKLIELHPDLLEARYLKAYALTQEKRKAEAEEEIRFILARDKKGEYALRIRELGDYLGRPPGNQPPRKP